MAQPGDVMSYFEMCREEGASLQRGMNYRLNAGHSVILMSRRPGAPYTDTVEEDGRILIYEGHDEPRRAGGPEPKSVDQPLMTPKGTPTENAKFVDAVARFRAGERPEPVRVYEKLRDGIWAFNGTFRLVDAWTEESNARQVFRFRLAVDEGPDPSSGPGHEPAVNRVIPTEVKLEVWRRDRGRCVECGSADNLHFDHVIPFVHGGSSLVAENIQLLCARHNLAKRDRIA